MEFGGTSAVQSLPRTFLDIDSGCVAKHMTDRALSNINVRCRGGIIL